MLSLSVGVPVEYWSKLVPSVLTIHLYVTVRFAPGYTFATESIPTKSSEALGEVGVMLAVADRFPVTVNGIVNSVDRSPEMCSSEQDKL